MPSLMDDLRDPTRLPDPTKKVELVQTHISMVFVADEYVYKIKKPVDFGFLDFSTLEKRRHFCGREVELNSRLSEGIYLEVLPVLLDGNHYSLRSGREDPIEYAVRMKRIPDEVLMKSLFRRGALDRECLSGVAGRLAGFHATSETNSEIESFGRAEMFRVNTDENFSQVEKYRGVTIDEGDFEALRDWTSAFYEKNEGLFMERIERGKIRDCHGDLHMEHICFTEPIAVIDCIEFNERFRYSDTLADIAFLLMDLEYNGGDEQARILWQEYKEAAREKNVDELMTFYKVYRAFVRGKVTSFRLDDESIEEDEKKEALETASRYFRLARSYI